jgi:hypothetical protein
MLRQQNMRIQELEVTERLWKEERQKNNCRRGMIDLPALLGGRTGAR